MERATGFEPAWAVRRLLGRQSPSSSRPSPHEAGHAAPDAESIRHGRVPTSPGRRCDARANNNPLAALLHGGPVFSIRIVKELHLSVRYRAQWRGRKNKKPGGLAHSPGWTQWFSGSGLTVLHPCPVCARDSSQAGQNASASVQERTSNRCSPRRNTAARLGQLWPAVSYRF
jgi:hypothetical protein